MGRSAAFIRRQRKRFCRTARSGGSCEASRRGAQGELVDSRRRERSWEERRIPAESPWRRVHPCLRAKRVRRARPGRFRDQRRPPGGFSEAAAAYWLLAAYAVARRCLSVAAQRLSKFLRELGAAKRRNRRGMRSEERRVGKECRSRW